MNSIKLQSKGKALTYSLGRPKDSVAILALVRWETGSLERKNKCLNPTDWPRVGYPAEIDEYHAEEAFITDQEKQRIKIDFLVTLEI